jgi:hypothetical protein
MGRPYDQSKRQTAALMQRENPHWLITYGVESRHYWAFPAFNAPSCTILSAADPGDCCDTCDR